MGCAVIERLVLGVTLAAGLAAGGLTPLAAPATRAAPGTDAGSPQLHAAELSAALLSDADLPSGWRVVDGAGPAPERYAWCPAGAALPVMPRAQAARSYWSDAPSPLLYHRVLAFRPGEAAGVLAALRAGSSACAWAETEADAEPMRFELGVAADVALGDEALRRRLTMRWEGGVAEADILIVRRGAFVLILTHVVVGAGPNAPDARLSDRVTERAVAKLMALARGAG